MCAVQIQIRRATSTQWSVANPVLAECEWGIELDTLKMKLGDGVTTWNQLPYHVFAADPEWGNITGNLADQEDLQLVLDGKQAQLISGTNIKTINDESILGAGNIEIVTDIQGIDPILVEQGGEPIVIGGVYTPKGGEYTGPMKIESKVLLVSPTAIEHWNVTKDWELVTVLDYNSQSYIDTDLIDLLASELGVMSFTLTSTGTLHARSRVSGTDITGDSDPLEVGKSYDLRVRYVPDKGSYTMDYRQHNSGEYVTLVYDYSAPTPTTSNYLSLEGHTDSTVDLEQTIFTSEGNYLFLREQGTGDSLMVSLKYDNVTLKVNSEGKLYADVNSAVWGNITGSIGDQTDLTDFVGTSITDSIVDNFTSTETTKSLSASKGKDLNDRLQNVESRGRFLSTWNCKTGLAGTEPTTNPYEYKRGDYFIVSVVDTTTNYRPYGTQYDKTVPSTTPETEVVKPNDTYLYDGTRWILQANVDRDVAFSTIAGSPYDNTNLKNALDNKYDANNPDGFQNATQVNTAISNHNTNTSAHSTQFAAKQPNLTSNNAGTGISITGSGANVKINNTQTSAEWGNITGDIADQDDLQTALSGKVDKNADITGATHSKITYDSKGLVTGGSDLTLGDFGITANASEINVLDGITATTAELNYTDGVTSNIQTQLNGKQAQLVSGSNIKTINSTTLLGSGNINLVSDVKVNGTSVVASNVANVAVPKIILEDID